MIRRSQIQGFLDQGRRIAERSVQGCSDTLLAQQLLTFGTISVRRVDKFA
jgi:hypothetical protein